MAGETGVVGRGAGSATGAAVAVGDFSHAGDLRPAGACPPAGGAEPDASSGSDPAKRRQILEGARRVFLEFGFDGASMGAIARAAGVSKGTLYVYFADKEHLFTAMIADERARLRHRFDLDAADPDVAASLNRMGRAVLSFIAGPANIRAVRTVMAISERIPEIGRAFYGDGPGRGIDNLAAFIEAHARAGRLVVADPRLAAAQFQMLLQAGVVNELMLCVRDTPDETEIARRVDEAVATFMARYGNGPADRRPPAKA